MRKAFQNEIGETRNDVVEKIKFDECLVSDILNAYNRTDNETVNIDKNREITDDVCYSVYGCNVGEYMLNVLKNDPRCEHLTIKANNGFGFQCW